MFVRRFSVILTFAAALACGEETPMTPDASAPAGNECSGLTQCGAGTSNAVTVQFCEHCFARPDTHVCEDGKCRALDTTATFNVGFGVPSFGRGAKSFTIATVNPIKADGSRVGCDQLLSGDDWKNNPRYNTGNSTFKAFAGAMGADPQLAYNALMSVDAGKDRMAVVLVVSDPQGKGTLMAKGCKAVAEILAGQMQHVDVALVRP